MPEKEAYLNTYLNKTYYQTLSDKNIIKNNAIYNIGPVRFEYTGYGQTIIIDIAKSEKYQWFGKIALIDITDYPRTNTNQANCGSIMLNISGINQNYENCKDTTWIYNYSDEEQYSINKFSYNGWGKETGNVWGICNNGEIINATVDYEYPTYPVLTLKSTVKIADGNGSKENAFIIKSKYN